MAYRKLIRFEYYEVVCQKNDSESNKEDLLYDLIEFIDKVDRLDLLKRTHNYKAEKARLETIRFDSYDNLWFLGFMKLRDTNIPSIAKENHESTPIRLNDDEFLGEHACAIYDCTNHILMLQRNVHSLGPTGVEWYINKALNDENQMVFLRPICPLDIQQKLLNAYEYRKFEIRLAHLNVARERNDAMKPFSAIIDSIHKYEPVNAALTVSVGREKKGVLNKEYARETVSELLESKDIVSGTKVSYRNSPDGEVEIMDLFEAKLHDNIPLVLEKRETVASEYMQRLMTEKYKESKGKIIAAISR